MSVLCKNTFPQIKITAQIFPAKTYSRGNTVCSNLNSQHKNTVPRNRVSLRKHPFLLALRRWGRFARRKVQTLVQKGLLNFFVANYFPQHPLPLVTEKAETTMCFSICESQSPLAREKLLCEQRRTDH